MKKQIFTMFYSLQVFKTIPRGSTPSGAPSAAPSAPKAAPGDVVEAKEKISYIKKVESKIQKLNERAKKIMKPKTMEVMGIKLPNDKKYEDFVQGLIVMKDAARDKLYEDKDMTGAKFKKFQQWVEKELKAREILLENMENKEFIAAELKKHFEKNVLEYVKMLDKNAALMKASNRREMLIMSSSYFSRWYHENLKALDQLNDNAALKQLSANFKSKPPKGELFDDLKEIKKDIDKNVLKVWIAGVEDKSKKMWRTVYKNENWEKSGYKHIKDEDLRDRIRNFDKNFYTKDTQAGFKGYTRAHGINVEKTVKDYVAWLIEQNGKNLPDLPDGRRIDIAAGIDVKQIVAKTKPAGAPSKKLPTAPSQKLPEVKSLTEKEKKYVQLYRAAHEKELRKLKGISFKPIKDPKFPDSIVYQIYKDGKALDRTYYRPGKQQYGLAGTNWKTGGDFNICAYGNITLLEKEYKLEALKSKELPKITEMSYKNGVLNIVGENLQKKPIKVKLPKTIKSGRLIKGGIAYESAKISNLVYGAENINNLLIKSALSAVEDSSLKEELAKSLRDRAKGIPVVKEILATGPKPTLQVVGQASFDGRYSGNVEIAKKRARNAKRKIEAKLGGAKKAEQVIHLVPVPEVIGPKGEPIKKSQLTQAYIDMKKMWNKLEGSKAKTGAEMRKIVSNYVNGKTKGLTAEQKQFLKEKLDKVRNVQVRLDAPKKPKEFTIRFKSGPEKIG